MQDLLELMIFILVLVYLQNQRQAEDENIFLITAMSQTCEYIFANATTCISWLNKYDLLNGKTNNIGMKLITKVYRQNSIFRKSFIRAAGQL